MAGRMRVMFQGAFRCRMACARSAVRKAADFLLAFHAIVSLLLGVVSIAEKRTLGPMGVLFPETVLC